jgi:uncharacterized protein DUF5676
MHPLSLRVMAWSWGLFGAVTFVACVVYGLVVPRAFHASQLLEQLLPGFRWLTPGSVLLGVGETFVYGAYAGLVFSLIHNAVLRRRGSRGG